MTTFKLLLPLLMLTFSCHNNKTYNASESDTTKAIITKTISGTNKQAAIDSVYLNQLEYIKENPYSYIYDTIIKGGFLISYSHETEYQFLIYRKGQKIIDTIGACSLGLPL